MTSLHQAVGAKSFANRLNPSTIARAFTSAHHCSVCLSFFVVREIRPISDSIFLLLLHETLFLEFNSIFVSVNILLCDNYLRRTWKQ